MQQTYILHNDEFIAADQPILSSQNRGFRYGDGLFESMRMINGKLKFPEQHADRLQGGMK
ncbi:MAG: 4-amino-4-deoxychorismate lyase, partial [Pedobacter sp.]